MTTRKKISLVFKMIDEYILKDNLEEVITILEAVNKISPVIDSKILIAYLSATNPLKNSSIKNSRDKLVDSVEKILIEELGEKRAIKILSGLI
jgi:hypothetical protein